MLQLRLTIVAEIAGGGITRYAAIPCFETTVTLQRSALPDPTVITEWTIPVTEMPFNVTVAIMPRYWAMRQRRASNGSVISIACMHHQWSRYAKTLCNDLHDIGQALTMIATRRFASGSMIKCDKSAWHVANIARLIRVQHSFTRAARSKLSNHLGEFTHRTQKRFPAQFAGLLIPASGFRVVD